MSILITCSSSKKVPHQIINSSLQSLSFHKELGDLRTAILHLTNITLDWTKTLPAWELYSGGYSKIFKKISQETWLNTNHNILILSALFGWIRHTDRIPYYDLKISSVLRNGQTVQKFWLSHMKLQSMIKDSDIDLLSINYRKALAKNGNIAACTPSEIKFTDRGDQKGRWLNNYIIKSTNHA
jgi:cytoplasmic iron level regulating protein YaaA (DUF328/UPF0246 family)